MITRRQGAVILAACFAIAATASAQQLAVPSPPPPIQDNSFLVEEAYNQERGVVQHISTFSHGTTGSAWIYTFTQEWPLGGLRHQLSYTVPVAHAESDDGVGVGDVALNYRFQALAAADGGAGVAFAPRLTVLLPTGASRRGLGAGGPGVQANLPVSVALAAAPIVLHSNVGATYVPRARNLLGDAAAAAAYGIGQSVVWLARPRLNFLLEATWLRSQDVAARGRTESSTELLLSPGVRGAVDFSSGLQVVPGLAFPIGVGPSRGARSVFVYLSLEHPFAPPAAPVGRATPRRGSP